MNPFFKSITLSIVFGAGLAAGMSFSSEMGQSAAEQRIFMQSVVSAVKDAAKRGDMQTVRRLTQEAYKTFSTFKKIDDMEKIQVLSQLEQAAKPTSSSNSSKKMLPEVEQKRAMSVQLQQVPARKVLSPSEQRSLNYELLMEFKQEDPDLGKIETLLSKGADLMAPLETPENASRIIDLYYQAKESGSYQYRYKTLSEGDFLFFVPIAHTWYGAEHNGKRRKFLDLLAKYGVDITKQNKHGDTILHYIARSIANEGTMNEMVITTSDCACDLMNQGVDPNIQNNKGQTALMLACGKKNEAGTAYMPAPTMEIVHSLMAYSADPFIVDKEGKTAIDYCNVNGVALWNPADDRGRMGILSRIINDYRKSCKQSFMRVMSPVTQQVLEPKELTGLIAEYLFGEK